MFHGNTAVYRALLKRKFIFFYCLVGLILFFPFPVQLLDVDVSLEFARKIKLPLKIFAKRNNIYDLFLS